MISIARPAPSEYAPYFGQYIAQVPEGDVLQILERQIEETVALLGDLPPEMATHRYAPGKWSVNQVVGHLSDTERVFAHRALRFSRGDRQPLPGFEQDDYVNRANFDDRSLNDVTEEFRWVRGASMALFGSMNEAMLRRRGIASGVEFTVRAIPYILAGHERHHLTVLRERYLDGHPEAP